MTKGLIITGMHRSGTSLVAQAFYKAGVFLGDDLLRPSPRNPDGYFEDKKVFQFHDRIFRANGVEWHSFRTLAKQSLHVSPDHKNEAIRLMDQSFQGHPIWGWKDPRATLFLSLWKEILPQAKFIFCFRRPEEVAGSLLRRGDFQIYSKQSNGQAMIALRLWTYYSRKIIEFASQNPDSCLLLFVPTDLLDRRSRDLVTDIVVHHWSCDLKDLNHHLAQTYKPDLMRQEVRKLVKALTKVYWPAGLMLRRLIQLHDQLLSQESGRTK